MAEIDLGSTSQRWVGWLAFVVLGLGVLVVFLVLSSLNAEHMALVADDDQLFVEKGDFLPWGRSAYVPSEAFEPIELPPGIEVELPLGECDDREACELRFYHATLTLGAALLDKPDPDQLERAKALIVRAQLFPSISLADREPIEDLTGGVHYVEALVMLTDARQRLVSTLKKLERSRIAGAGDKVRLDLLIDLVRRQIDELDQALAPSAPPEPVPDTSAPPAGSAPAAPPAEAAAPTTKPI